MPLNKETKPKTDDSLEKQQKMKRKIYQIKARYQVKYI